MKYSVFHYICKKSKWVFASDYEIEYGACTAERDGEKQDSVICKNSTWRLMTGYEYYGACNSTLQGTMFGKYVCDNKNWRTLSSDEIKLGEACINEIQNKVVKYSEKTYYRCYNKKWYTSTYLDYEYGICTADDSDKNAVYNDTIYACIHSTSTGINEYYWKSTYVNAILGTCLEENYGTVKEYKNEEYLCKYLWRKDKNQYDNLFGFCSKDKIGNVETNNDTLFICTENFEWIRARKDTFLGECSNSNSGDKKTFYGQEYICRGDGWEPVFGTLTDSRNGQSYRTVVLKNAVWMAENLNYETENSWCFEDVASKCSQHGRLYTYEAALKACPTGWHLPDVEHDYYNTVYQSYVYTSPTGWQGASGTGYSDLYIEGSGIRKASGNFIYENRLSGFWFADELNSDTAFVKCEVDPSYSVRSECYNTNRELPTASNYSSSIAPKKDAYPVRCVKD